MEDIEKLGGDANREIVYKNEELKMIENDISLLMFIDHEIKDPQNTEPINE